MATQEQKITEDTNPINENATITAIKLPMPTLIKNNIDLWFIQLDYWFQVNNIKGDTQKFGTVIAALDGSLLEQIYNTIQNPPATQKYEAIKQAIIKNFADSEKKRIQKIVSGLQLGDKKPSHLLSELQRISGSKQDEQLLKGLWLQRLPVEVQTCLATIQVELPKMAELADNITETISINSTMQGTYVNAANVPAAAQIQRDAQIEQLQREVTRLTKMVSKLSTEHRSRTNQRSRSTSRNRQCHDDSEEKTSTNCWYHRTYGSNAKNCKQPCTYGTKN
ncbi:uncharacterized protein LOC119666368 [Teleopsis dalmanni]|uniref:uncharacterized protein LOC119666368 n=1 Tax=Teleopsis dalmanni TaxID=139649 RepID=UPI0018CE1241|nr:uncharacterized protein LOC119666368 [Teleopsis dalmanni]